MNPKNSGKSVAQPPQQFGGDWTSQKLECVRKYLVAYATIMQRQQFRFAYIDAFAGTGYNTVKQPDSHTADLFPELATADSARFLDGSARIALKVEPRFTKYIFIEKDPKRFIELRKLQDEFPAVAQDIILINADSNAYLLSGLFGIDEETQKIADFKAIARFFVERLQSIFPGVARNPLELRNSANTPLYMLCFAAANSRGAKTAVKIAQDILIP